MSLIVSAPGKIHLMGEHAVVYGKPALLAAIDKRLYVEIKSQKSKVKSQKGEIHINSREEVSLVREAVAIFKESFRIEKLDSIEITITSQIPIGCGLGASAAIAAGVIGSLLKHIKNIWNPTRINELAFEVEKIAHGNPSGADNTTVVFGGLVWFRREFDFLKSIWSLPIKGYKIPPFLIINTGKPLETTKEMVAIVADRYKKNKTKMEQVFSDQEIQTKKLLLSLKKGDFEEMVQAIFWGERNLEKMGVVSSYAKQVIREIEENRGVAKVCGGGGRKKGSGIVLCYHRQLAVIKEVAQKHGLSAFDVVLGEEGIRLESSNTTNYPITQ